nr:hypothetical protein [Desulfobacula sp.]
MKKFSVATFNLLNLNEPGLPIYKDTKGWSQTQYNRKIAWTARQIDLLNADVLASRSCGTRTHSGTRSTIHP